MLEGGKLRILVTGGAGFIGSRLVEHLLKRGQAVSILDDFSAGSPHAIRASYNFPDFYCMKGSVTDAALVETMMTGVDAVFHLAAQVHVEESILDPRLSFDVNTTGMVNVLEAARRTRPKFILYASSSEVYGSAVHKPTREDRPIAPKSPYAAGKAAADSLCLAYHATYKTPVVVLRQFNTYGPGQRFKGYSAVIPQFAAQLFKGKPPHIFGDGRQSRDFHCIEDLVRAYDLVMERHERLVGRAINLGTGVETSVETLARTMIDVAASEWKRPELLKVEPVYMAPRPGEVDKCTADISLASRELDFKPSVDLKQGLRTYLRWFLEANQDDG